MVWKNKYIGASKYTRPTTRLQAVRKIVLHYTANNGGSANGHYNYFNNLTGRYASAHIFVDKIEALCIIPLNEVAYHANDRTYRGVSELRPNANLLSIGVEMCMEKDGTFHPSMIARTENVVAELCRIYGLNPLEDVVRHFDVTGKICPAPWVSNSSLFFSFKSRVNSKMKNPVAEIIDPTPLLAKGDSGEFVKKLQSLLVTKGYKVDVDGFFGAGTDGIVKKFQEDQNLEADGYVGDATWEELLSKPEVIQVSNPVVNKGAKDHTVEKGETFYSISKKYGMALENLQKYNARVKPNELKVGDVIHLVPFQADEVATVKPAVKPIVKPVAKPVVKPVVKPKQPVKGKAVVLATVLNIRKDSDLESAIVGKCQKNQKFDVYEVKNGMLKIAEGKWISAGATYVKYTPNVVVKPKPKASPFTLKYEGYLRKGDKGLTVVTLQKALNELNFKVGVADGIFGAGTEDAVKRFQSVYLPSEVDGIAGQGTMKKINSLLS